MIQTTDDVKGMSWLQLDKQGAEHDILCWKDGGGEIQSATASRSTATST